MKQPETICNEQETTWNDLQMARNYLKQPTATYNNLKRPATTYNKQETTWSDLQRARKDLKPPTSRKKQPETIYNEQETTWNDLQGLEKTRNKQETTSKRPTTSKKRPETTHNKTQPIMTWTYLQRAKKMPNDRQQADFQIILQYGANLFSSLIRFPPNIWLQSFEYCFTENHGHCRASNISIVSCVFFMGFNIYFFLSGFRVKNINKSQDSRERERPFCFMNVIFVLKVYFSLSKWRVFK